MQKLTLYTSVCCNPQHDCTVDNYKYGCSYTNVSPPQVLGGYQCYEHLYVREREATIQEFQASSPHFSEFEGEMELYEKLEGEITELPASRYLNAAIQLSTGQSLTN